MESMTLNEKLMMVNDNNKDNKKAIKPGNTTKRGCQNTNKNKQENEDDIYALEEPKKKKNCDKFKSKLMKIK